MNVKYFISFFVAALLMACTPPAKPLEDIFCNKELEEFIGGADSLPLIPLHYKTFKDSITHYMAPFIKMSTADIEYRVQIIPDSNFKPINVKVWYTNPNRPPAMEKRDIIEVRLNSAGQILFEGDLLERDSVVKGIYSYFRNRYDRDNYSFESIKHTGIYFMWDSGVDQMYFDEVLWSIVVGNVDFLDYVCMMEYDKSICEMDEAEKKSVLDNMAFKLWLHCKTPYPAPPIPAPPPPPSYYNGE